MKNINTVKTILVFAMLLALTFTLLVSCEPRNGGDTTTNAPSTSTPTGDVSSADPESSTKEPEQTTTAPIQTTKEPEQTTKAPELTTAPEVTTKEPEQTTKAPETTNNPSVLPEPATEGSFVANTNTTLGFKIDWKLNEIEGGYAYIDVEVVLSTYRLTLSGRKNLGAFTVGEETLRYSTDKIVVEGPAKEDVVLYKNELRLPLTDGKLATYVETKWFFNGTYNEIELDWLTVGGYIVIEAPAA